MDPITQQFTMMANPLSMMLVVATIGIALNVGLEQIFDTKFYRINFGKGLDGTGSRFFQVYELRPWVAMACGIAIAIGFSLQYFASALAINPADLPAGTNTIDNILTGLLISGGAKSYHKFKTRTEKMKGGPANA